MMGKLIRAADDDVAISTALVVNVPRLIVIGPAILHGAITGRKFCNNDIASALRAFVVTVVSTIPIVAVIPVVTAVAVIVSILVAVVVAAVIPATWSLYDDVATGTRLVISSVMIIVASAAYRLCPITGWKAADFVTGAIGGDRGCVTGAAGIRVNTTGK